MMISLTFKIFFIPLLVTAFECELHPSYQKVIRSQFEPFENGITEEMLNLSMKHAPCKVYIMNHTLTSSCQNRTGTYDHVKSYLAQIAKDLPDMPIPFNGADEPNAVKKNVCGGFFKPNQTQCFCDQNFKRPTHGFFSPLKRINTKYVFRIMFSLSKVKECYLDILMPASHYFSQDIYNNFIPPKWQDKQFKVFWRGSLMDTYFPSTNYEYEKYSQRVNFVNICKQIPECDGAFTGYGGTSPTVKEDLKKKYPFSYKIPMAKQANYKIIIDVDGISFSARFPVLLKLGVAVFKAKVFDDIGNVTPQPWVHYVPLLEDFSDLKQKIQWAKNNDEELRRIAQRGYQFAHQVHTNKAYQCYFKHLLLRYYQLIQKGQNITISNNPPK